MATSPRKKKPARVALITGAAVGIGAAIAKHLAKDGFRVILSDKDLKAATKTARAIETAGGQASPLEMDISSPSRSPKPSNRCNATSVVATCWSTTLELPRLSLSSIFRSTTGMPP